mmetsp:Transcript_19265/g.53348  ORF Transcript_19265/g.53348 Transcript_19265/m.53348 type:complete len:199 (+) Transcript_19265:1989-2585(+)
MPLEVEAGDDAGDDANPNPDEVDAEAIPKRRLIGVAKADVVAGGPPVPKTKGAKLEVTCALPKLNWLQDGVESGSWPGSDISAAELETVPPANVGELGTVRWPSNARADVLEPNDVKDVDAVVGILKPEAVKDDEDVGPIWKQDRAGATVLNVTNVAASEAKCDATVPAADANPNGLDEDENPPNAKGADVVKANDEL